MDYNSIKNQDIKRQFVQREVLACMSSVMDEVFAAGLTDYENIENYWVYPEYRGRYAAFDGGSEEQRQEEIDRLQEMIEERENMSEECAVSDEISKLEDEIQYLERLETQPQEIYEWWLVTDWLYDKLEEIGEPVLEWGSLHIWGRGCSGQAILLDYSISKICEGMEILEGQQYEWK